MAPSTRTLLLRRADGELTELDPADHPSERLLPAEPGTLVWLDLLQPGRDDLALLTEKIGLHQLALEDLEKRHQRPKLDTYPGQHVLVAYEVVDHEGDDRDFGLGEIHFIAGKGYIVSVHWEPSPALHEVQQRWRQQVARSARTAASCCTPSSTPSPMATSRCSTASATGSSSSRTNHRRPAPRRTGACCARSCTSSGSCSSCAGWSLPLRDVANALLRRDVPVVDEPVLPYYQDLYDHLVRVLDSVDIAREMLAATLDANLSVTSNNLNVVVKRLTAFTVILMVPTLIAGIYGMNFHFMPELAWPFGYALALAAMAASMIVA